MNSKKTIIGMLVGLAIFSSCKKNLDNITENATLKVKYELTTTSPFVTDIAYVNLNTFSFTKDSNRNGETVNNLNGKNWTKEVSVENKKKMILGFGGTFLLQGTTGSCNAKIYVDGKLKAETIQSASVAINGMTSTGLSIQWVNQ